MNQPNAPQGLDPLLLNHWLRWKLLCHEADGDAFRRLFEKVNAALGDLTPEKIAHLCPGEAYLWSSKATDEVFCKDAIKVKCRSREI